jgi:hypothetical protein
VERLTTQRCWKPIRRGITSTILLSFISAIGRQLICLPQLSFQARNPQNGNRVRRGRLAEKERADHAERTKAQISRKREASALGKLSAATRRCRDLEEQLGESEKHATITKVEKATGRKGEFKFAPLRRWCRDKGIEAKNVPDERYGSVKSWPAGAWLAVYGIELKSLFGRKNNAES